MIRSIGIEIEGAWNEVYYDFKNNDVFRHDGSVDIPRNIECRYCRNGDNDNCECSDDGYNEVGELAFQPKTGIVDAILELDQNYPDHTNRSCGLHIHLGLSEKEYMTILWQYSKFYREYIAFLRYFGQTRAIRQGSAFWSRLSGENRYCRLDINLKTIKDQMKNSSYDNCRYNHVNFCYSKHGTIELRSFPAFQTKALSLDAVRSVYDFVNMWLLNNQIEKTIEVRI